MQIKDVRPESFIKQIRCDRCGRLAELGEVEFQDFVSIALKAGYASIFGDGNDVQIDLCQYCLRSSLGPWLRVSGAAARLDLLEDRLLRFDAARHGVSSRRPQMFYCRCRKPTVQRSSDVRTCHAARDRLSAGAWPGRAHMG
ncbi:NMD protein affecting ribosome stability and mRNA decay [Pelomonas aquatica]|uniref:NMD protein affecting ribosome stability and mRNA decay n=1 Tax=Pelomonas aquatica TaxID=431058 RepID=A0ABU1ZFU3_9BURK|nr:hypothetical protein [Pelomonas aquatica]MDR7299502.1 NMD protein affecting ribosome stability and mRNA decay [Pelomonas aquatica]